MNAFVIFFIVFGYCWIGYAFILLYESIFNNIEYKRRPDNHYSKLTYNFYNLYDYTPSNNKKYLIFWLIVLYPILLLYYIPYFIIKAIKFFVNSIGFIIATLFKL